jgi:transcriptional regulator with GAF, ATPase, and Fis domain
MGKRPLEVSEAEVTKALEESKGNQRAAAQKLGASQAWLTRYLQRNNYRQVIKWEKVQS